MQSKHLRTNSSVQSDESPQPTPLSHVSSPAPDMEPFEDEGALFEDEAPMDEGEGEELFGDNMEK
jgi:hypothetical protein